jgi:transposase
LVKERGVAVAQADRDLDVHENVLRRWVREFAAAKQDAFPGHDQMKVEQQDIQRLRQEVANLKAERDILKNRPGSGPPARGRNGLCYGADRRVAADSLLVA